MTTGEAKAARGGFVCVAPVAALLLRGACGCQGACGCIALAWRPMASEAPVAALLLRGACGCLGLLTGRLTG